MSAPDNAKPIGEPDTNMDDGKISPLVKCYSCNWEGRWMELLGVDDEKTLWCPLCKSSGWEFI